MILTVTTCDICGAKHQWRSDEKQHYAVAPCPGTLEWSELSFNREGGDKVYNTCPNCTGLLEDELLQLKATFSPEKE